MSRLPCVPERLYSINMIREWFDAGDAIAFAREMARELDRLYPPALQKSKPTSAKKDQKKLDKLILRTRNFAQQHKLNVYKKAKLLNTVKWELRDAGHDKTFIDDIVALLTQLLR